MLGFIRNSIQVSKKPISSIQAFSAFVGGRNINEVASKHACQQCNIASVQDTPSWFQVPSRFFGTLRTLVSSSAWKAESNELLVRATHYPFPGLNSSENSSSIVGGAYLVQSRGMKYKGRVKRRCKDCYLMWVNGMLYNLCKTHPRHKAGLKPAYYANQRLLTHATMSPKRPW